MLVLSTSSFSHPLTSWSNRKMMLNILTWKTFVHLLAYIFVNFQMVKWLYRFYLLGQSNAASLASTTRFHLHKNCKMQFQRILGNHIWHIFKIHTSYFPRFGFCFPAKIFKAVDFPIPLVPTNPSTSPGRGIGNLHKVIQHFTQQ